jgi:hypothetical protein
MAEESSQKLPLSEFSSHLINMNRLDRLGFDRFVFFPGMLFLTFESWWGKNSVRKTAHEGLDICFFINNRQGKYRLDETVQIPILFEGLMVHQMKDLLGQTIVVRHSADLVGEKTLLSFYAHIMPNHRIRMGDVIQPGQSLGTIVDPQKANSRLLPHLHVSLAWESMLPPVSVLTWNLLNQVDRSVFLDPLEVLPKTHLMFMSTPDKHEIPNSVKCSLALKKA